MEKNHATVTRFYSKAVNQIFHFIQKKNFPIDSVVIVKNGYLIGELYANKSNEKHSVIFILLQKALPQHLSELLLIMAI